MCVKDENSCIGRIPLKSLVNTRDLGGYQTMDGRRILPGRLIRSGALYEAATEDIKLLTKEYRLGTIIDFRTGEERRQKPDPEIPGVKNLFNPILDEKTVGITFEEEAEKKKSAVGSLLAHAASMEGKPENYINQLYEDLALNPHAAKAYGSFFDLLINADDRAILWHCTAGKDRVGIGTALLLSALGVDRATIIRDFMQTNVYVKESVERTAALAEEETKDAALAECIRVLLTVSEDSILHAFAAMERKYGDIDAYLERHIGLTKEKKKGLRRKFLEG